MLETHERAGDTAHESHFYGGAAKHYQDALNTPAIASADRLRISEKLARTLFLGADPSVANPSLSRIASSHSRSVTEKMKILELLYQRVRQLWSAFKTEEALSVIADATQIAKTLDDPYFLKMANLRMVCYLRQLNRYHEAKHHLGSLEDVSSDDDVAVRVTYYMEKAVIASAFGDAPGAYENFKACVAAAEDDSDFYRVTAIWESYGLCALTLGATDLAKTCIERALLIARQHHIMWRIPHLCLYYARILDNMGQHEVAYDYLLDALSYDAYAPVLDGLLADVGIPLALRMKDEKILTRCARPSTLRLVFKSHIPSEIGPVSAAFAQFYAAQGNTHKMRRLLRRALAVVHHADFSWDLLLEVARHGAISDASQARTVLKARIAFPYNAVAQAYLSLFDAFMAQRRKEFDLAQIHANKAIQRFDSLQWHAYADIARSFLPGTLVKARPTSPERGQAFSNIRPMLTLRERQVAELVLKGFTNREIATKLLIKERTVEAHMTAIMSAVGVRSRHQLTTAFGES